MDKGIILQEITRLKNRQIARTFSDINGFQMPKVVEDRIKQGFYDLANDLEDFIKNETKKND
jgi:hypothetical protein